MLKIVLNSLGIIKQQRQKKVFSAPIMLFQVRKDQLQVAFMAILPAIIPLLLPIIVFRERKKLFSAFVSLF